MTLFYYKLVLKYIPCFTGCLQTVANKRNKFIAWPCINTLKKYINYTNLKSGFNAHVIKKFAIDSKLHKLEPFQINVSLCFEKIKLQQGLLYKRSPGKLVGFCEMGDNNQEIEIYQATIIVRLFPCFTRILFQHKWNEARLLIINMVYTSYSRVAERLKILDIRKLEN